MPFIGTWYQHPETETGTWQYRVAISVDTSNGAGGTSDITMTVPKTLDHFWANVQSDGDDVRICYPDGTTKATYQLQTWTYASRIAVIEVDDSPVPADASVMLMWLYYGNSTATDGAGSFTAGTTRTAYIYEGGPGLVKFLAQRERPGQTTPSVEIHKTSTETLFVFMQIDPMLARRKLSAAGKQGLESVGYLEYSVDSSGTPQAGMIDVDEIRFMETPAGEFWARMTIQAGSDATNYTLNALVHTSPDTASSLAFHQKLNPRALIKVNDPTE